MQGTDKSIKRRLLALPRHRKRLIQVAVDVVLIWLALWLAFYLRIGDVGRIEPFGSHAWLFLAAPVVSLPVFIRLGMYRAVMRYLGDQALMSIARAVSLSALLLSLAIFLYGPEKGLLPRSLIINYWWISLFLTGGLRLAMRQYFTGNWLNLPLMLTGSNNGLTRVAIYGAGRSGNQLAKSLFMGRSMRPVAFIDDNPSLSRGTIAGLPVYLPEQIAEMLEETRAEEILLAIPSATRRRRHEILEMLEPLPVHVRSVPGIMDLLSGRVQVTDLQEVDIADLLGRDPVDPQPQLLQRCIRNQVVMVTGAGGSIGSELCRQILASRPTTLILFEHSEYNLYSIHMELQQRIRQEGMAARLIPILGSIRNPTRLLDVMHSWKVDTIYHAAAYKHVPMVEHNITEGVFNNTLGTLHTAQAAIQAGVANFVLISTDKAVRPTNVMGCTKRMAELVLQALAAETQVTLYGTGSTEVVANRTRFTMVRFGNVLGSSGSVIPLFRQQILRGGPVTVTHPDITRYFMTIPEAAQLVIQAGSMGKGGDVFVLDMGEPVKIAQLAEQMVLLSGLTLRTKHNLDGDIAIEFTGLRPGEKLYEELLIGENVLPTEHSMIMRANEQFFTWEELKPRLAELQQALLADDFSAVQALLQLLVSGYTPESGIVDLVYQQRCGCTPEQHGNKAQGDSGLG